MRLSKQERIAVLIVMAILIIALGTFFLIKPAIESFNSTVATLASKTIERDNMVARRETKKPLRKSIEEAYASGEHLAEMFFPEFTAYEADEAFRAFLEQCEANVVVESLTVSEATTATLESHFFVPTEIEYALKTYATSGVQPTEEEAKLAARRQALQTALSEPQTIGASVVEFAVSAKVRDEILKFADEINDYVIKEAGGNTRKALMLNGIELTYEEVNEKYDALIEENMKFMDAEGESALAAEVGADAPKKPEPVIDPDEEKEPSLAAYLFTFEGSVTFYSLERMQNPKAQLDLQDGVAA